MANARKPDNVLKMQGTYRKDRHGDPDLKINLPEPDSYPAPERLTDLGKQVWFRVTNQFKGTGMLAEIDLDPLEAYCDLIAWRDESTRDKFPIYGHSAIRGYMRDLGIGAANRSKLKMPSKPSTGNRFDAVKKKAQ